jgi:acetylglutamate kinase
MNSQLPQLTIVKVGGKIIDDAETLNTLLKQFSIIAGSKIIVHGGGRTATEIADRLGVKSVMVEGRRITDADMLKVATMVYAGLVNKDIVVKLQALNVDAVGLTGADMNIIRAIKRPVEEIDYGFVADVREVTTSALTYLLKRDYVPVLAPLSHDGYGNLLNTNADTVAAETARAMALNYRVRLIYCFEKRGVLTDENDDNSVIPELNRELYAQYREEGVINAGMIPKLDNAFRAIASGVNEIVITSAANINVGGGTHIK